MPDVKNDFCTTIVVNGSLPGQTSGLLYIRCDCVNVNEMSLLSERMMYHVNKDSVEQFIL